MPYKLYAERIVTEASPEAVKVIKSSYPAAVVDYDFIKSVAVELENRGFSRGQAIAFVDTCRDEAARPLASLIDETYGPSFNIAGLGGLITAGTIGFKAGMSHSPVTNSREKYVFFAFPHISVSENGGVGDLWRPGQEKINHACGALLAIKGLAKDAKSKEDPIDLEDLEFSVLKSKLLSNDLIKSSGPEGPDLVTVTNAALQVINQDLEKIISKVVDTSKADYAVVTGVQIHSGAQVEGEPFLWEKFVDYISPSLLYTVVNGKKIDFGIP